jgi:hypothetical protein
MMMKKLLALFLVLGMASWANAFVIDISVNGQWDIPDTAIYLTPSEEVIIDLHMTDNTGWPSGGQGTILFVTGNGSLDGSMATGWESTSYVDTKDDGTYEAYKSGLEGLGYTNITDIAVVTIFDAGATPGDTPANSTILLDDVVFHCTDWDPDEGMTTVWLLNVDMPTEVYSSQQIHQLPEPMTVALLGLGGLFLLRRRR